jgi:hypothetical protein
MAEDSKRDIPRMASGSDRGDLDIQSSAQSDLSAINENLTKRIKEAKTPEEIEKLLKLKESLQNQRLKQIEQETAQFRLQEAQEQMRLNRRLTIIRELFTIAASITAVGIGWYLINNSPLFAAFLIVFGLAKPLQYSLGEISNLLTSLSELTKNQSGLPRINQSSGRISDENPEESIRESSD